MTTLDQKPASGGDARLDHLEATLPRIFQQLIASQIEPAPMATITLVTVPPFVEKAMPGWRSGFQRRHVDHKAILHVTLQHALVGGIDVLNLDDLDIRDDAVLSTEVEQFLGLGNAADD